MKILVSFLALFIFLLFLIFPWWKIVGVGLIIAIIVYVIYGIYKIIYNYLKYTGRDWLDKMSSNTDFIDYNETHQPEKAGKKSEQKYEYYIHDSFMFLQKWGVISGDKFLIRRKDSEYQKLYNKFPPILSGEELANIEKMSVTISDTSENFGNVSEAISGKN